MTCCGKVKPPATNTGPEGHHIIHEHASHTGPRRRCSDSRRSTLDSSLQKHRTRRPRKHSHADPCVLLRLTGTAPITVIR